MTEPSIARRGVRRRPADRGRRVHGDGRRQRGRLRPARPLRAASTPVTCPIASSTRSIASPDRSAATRSRASSTRCSRPRGRGLPAPMSNWVVAALVHDIGDELAPYNHSEYGGVGAAALRAGRGALGGAPPRRVPELLLRPSSRRRSQPPRSLHRSPVGAAVPAVLRRVGPELVRPRLPDPRSRRRSRTTCARCSAVRRGTRRSSPGSERLTD